MAESRDAVALPVRPAMSEIPPTTEQWKLIRLRDIGCDDPAKLPKDLAQTVIGSIGGEFTSLNIAQLASFLQPYGILSTSVFQVVTTQNNETDRRNTLQTCLLQLQTQKSFRQRLPTDLYLACLDSFEEEPALSPHHFFAVSILRPKILEVLGVADSSDPQQYLSNMPDITLPQEIADELKGYLNIHEEQLLSTQEIMGKYFSSDSGSVERLVRAFLCTPTLGRKLSGLFPYAHCNGPEVHRFFQQRLRKYWYLFARHCGFTQEEERRIIYSSGQSEKAQIKFFLRCFWIPAHLVQNIGIVLEEVCMKISERLPPGSLRIDDQTSRGVLAIQPPPSPPPPPPICIEEVDGADEQVNASMQQNDVKESHGAENDIHVPTELIQLCTKNKWNDVEKLMEENGVSIDATNPQDGRRALMYAAIAGKTSIVELLLSKGANPDVIDKDDGTTPLKVAAEINAVEAVEHLLERGANPDGNLKDHQCPLIEASSRGYERVMKLLLQHGANPDCQDKDGSTPLLLAIQCRQQSVINLLLLHKANINRSDRAGTTPIFAAIEAHSIENVLELIHKGANVNTKRQRLGAAGGYVEETPLAFAAGLGNVDIVQALIAAGADVNRILSGLVPPIGFAVICNQRATFDLLLKNENLHKSIDALRHPIVTSVKTGNLYFARRILDVLGGVDHVLEQATSQQLTTLVQSINHFISAGGLDVTSNEDMDFSSQPSQQYMSQHNFKAEEVLHKFCQICRQTLLSQTRKTPDEIIQQAQGLGHPEIANFLTQLYSKSVRPGDLKREFLRGKPSAFAFLVRTQTLTIDDFQENVIYACGDMAEDFCQTLVYTFRGMPGGQELPTSVEPMLQLLFAGGFCPGVASRRADTAELQSSFGSRDVLPYEATGRVHDFGPYYDDDNIPWHLLVDDVDLHTSAEVVNVSSKPEVQESKKTHQALSHTDQQPLQSQPPQSFVQPPPPLPFNAQQSTMQQPPEPYVHPPLPQSQVPSTTTVLQQQSSQSHIHYPLPQSQLSPPLPNNAQQSSVVPHSHVQHLIPQPLHAEQLPQSHAPFPPPPPPPTAEQPQQSSVPSHMQQPLYVEQPPTPVHVEQSLPPYHVEQPHHVQQPLQFMQQPSLPAHVEQPPQFTAQLPPPPRAQSNVQWASPQPLPQPQSQIQHTRNKAHLGAHMRREAGGDHGTTGHRKPANRDTMLGSMGKGRTAHTYHGVESSDVESHKEQPHYRKAEAADAAARSSPALAKRKMQRDIPAPSASRKEAHPKIPTGAIGRHSKHFQRENTKATRTPSSSHTGSQQQRSPKQQGTTKQKMTHTSATDSPISKILHVREDCVKPLGNMDPLIYKKTNVFFQQQLSTTRGRNVESNRPMFQHTSRDEHRPATAPTPDTEESDNLTSPHSPPEEFSPRDRYSHLHTATLLNPQFQRSKSSPMYATQEHDQLDPSRTPSPPQHNSHDSETPEGASSPENQDRQTSVNSPGSRPGVLQVSNDTHFARQHSSCTSTPTQHQEASLGAMGATPSADSPTPQLSSRLMSSRRAMRGLNYPIDLKIQRVEAMLEELSRAITSSSGLHWTDIGTELGLEDKVLHDIDEKYHFPEEKCYQMLCCSIRQRKSSFKELRDAFNEMELYDLCVIIRKARTDIYIHRC